MSILASHTGADWSRGRYRIERACSCSKHQRAAECVTDRYHTVATSDDLTDARGALATWRADRVVDSHTGRVV